MDVPIPCPCPTGADGQPPHDHDTVTLRDRLDFHRAAAIKGDIILLKVGNSGASPGETLAVLSAGYVHQGIESWTLVDEDGKPLPVTHLAIDERILARLDIAFLVADEADSLYAEAVMLPLLGLASPSSPDTPTASSTSREPSPSETSSSTSPTLLRTPSRRSSTSTSPTAGTGTTTASRAGDSSSSPSSTSAA